MTFYLEKARKISTTKERKRSAENNNQGFVNYGVVEEETMSETERNLRQRMKKRSAMMRQREAEIEEQHEHNSSTEDASITRNFRYIRRKPTIISYRPPQGDPEDPELVEVSVDSNDHTMILDRVNNTPSMQYQDLQEPGSSKTSARLEMIKVEDPEGETDETKLTKPLVVYLDGPFGAPTSQIFRAQHAVLIGTGIGVTPFASILQSIMHRYWQARNTCPKCQYKWTNDLSASVGLNLRKVDFFWINRDQRSFEWFVNLLSQLEIEQAEQGGAMERFLDMHMYITSALQKTDMKAVGLQLALDLLHKKSKRDLITGLKTRTNAGRPNWDKVFKELQAQKKGKITVFFCGSPQLGKILKLKCDEFGFDYRKENF